MNQDKISLYSGVSPKVTGEATYQQVLRNIKNGKYKKQVLEARKLYEQGDKARYSELKKKLPGASFGGMFSYRSNDKLLSPTGFLTVDLDHLPDVKAVMNLLKKDEYVWFAFISPSGNGLKVFLRASGIVDDRSHKEFFQAVQNYFKSVYGLEIDPSGKDICRLCFLSYDPELFINKESTLFEVLKWQAKPKAPKHEVDYDALFGECNGSAKKYALKVLQSACEKIRTTPLGTRHHTRLRQARLIGGYVPKYLSEQEALDALEAAVEASNTDNVKNAMKTIRDGFKYGKLSPIFIESLRKSNSITPSRQATPKLRTVQELSESFSRDIKFLWRQHIPASMPSMLAGREGSGKTTIALKIAEEILASHEMGLIIWIAAEGAVADTIDKARKIGLADNRRFLIGQKPDESFRFDFRASYDYRCLETILKNLNEPLLAVIVDSVRGMAGSDDNDSRVGGIMHKLNSVVCDKYQGAIIYLDHEKKGKADTPLDQISGTTAKAAAVRQVLSIRVTSTYTRKIVKAKSNLSATIPELKSIEVDGKLFIVEEKSLSDQSAVERAEKWLLELLNKNGKIPAREVYSLAQKEGIAQATLKRAKSRLGIKSVQERPGSPWIWVSPIETMIPWDSVIPWERNTLKSLESREDQREDQTCQRITEDQEDHRGSRRSSKNKRSSGMNPCIYAPLHEIQSEPPIRDEPQWLKEDFEAAETLSDDIAIPLETESLFDINEFEVVKKDKK